MPSLVEIGPVDLEKKSKIGKVYRRTDRQTTDERRSEKLTWAFSSGELKRYLLVVLIKITNLSRKHDPNTCVLRAVKVLPTHSRTHQLDHNNLRIHVIRFKLTKAH